MNTTWEDTEDDDYAALDALTEEMDAASTDIWGMFGEFDPYGENNDEYEMELAMNEALERIAAERNPAIQAEAARQFSTLTYNLGAQTFADFDTTESKLIERSHSPWIEVKDGDPRLYRMFQEHYSYQDKPRTNRLCIGPGYKIALIVPHKKQPATGKPRAIFAWRLERYRADNNWGANCAFFRNKTGLPGSELILAAEQFARLRWPYVARMFTHVDPAYVEPKTIEGKQVWGAAYIHAGWRMEPGRTATGLVTLSKITPPLGWYDASWQIPQPWSPPERKASHDPVAAGTPRWARHYSPRPRQKTHHAIQLPMW